jgi:hypothetical protein
MIHRYLVAVSQIVEIDDNEGPSDGFDVDRVQDSILDDVNDGIDVLHETSDGKFDYTPKEVVNVTVTKLGSV